MLRHVPLSASAVTLFYVFWSGVQAEEMIEAGEMEGDAGKDFVEELTVSCRSPGGSLGLRYVV